MDEINHDQKHQGQWRVDHRHNALRAGDKVAHDGQVAQWPGDGLRHSGRAGDAGVQRAAFKSKLKSIAQAQQEFEADGFQKGVGGDKNDDDQRQVKQGGCAAREQHAVKHLQRVNRHGQHQQVHHHRDEAHRQGGTARRVAQR